MEKTWALRGARRAPVSWWSVCLRFARKSAIRKFGFSWSLIKIIILFGSFVSLLNLAWISDFSFILEVPSVCEWTIIHGIFIFNMESLLRWYYDKSRWEKSWLLGRNSLSSVRNWRKTAEECDPMGLSFILQVFGYSSLNRTVRWRTISLYDLAHEYTENMSYLGICKTQDDPPWLKSLAGKKEWAEKSISPKY